MTLSVIRKRVPWFFPEHPTTPHPTKCFNSILNSVLTAIKDRGGAKVPYFFVVIGSLFIVTDSKERPETVQERWPRWIEVWLHHLHIVGKSSIHLSFGFG